MNRDLAELLRFIGDRHRKRLLRIASERISSLILIFLGLTTLLNILFAVFPLTILPLVWDVSAVLFCFGCPAILLDLILFRPPAPISTARFLERMGEERVKHPLLSIALELSESPEKNGFYDVVFSRAASQIETYRKVSYHERKAWLFPMSVVLILLTATSFLIQPRLTAYWKLPFMLFKGYDFTVYPGSVDVPRYASVSLKLVPHRPLEAPSCRLEIIDLKFGKQLVRRIRPDKTGAFCLHIDSCASSFVYRFNYGAIWCRPETVTVVPPPVLKGLQVELQPPPYTGLPRKKLSEGQGDFSAYAGTAARFALESSPLRAAYLIYGRDTIKLRIEGTKATGELQVKKSGFYGFSLIDTFLQKNDSLPRFTINILPDESPMIRFIRPATNKCLEPAQRETLLVEAADDLGVKSVFLFWTKNRSGSENPSHEDLSPPKPIPQWQRSFIWNISRLSLYPGDTLFYWAEVRDNKAFGKPQYAVTDTFWFRIPTFDEIHRAIAQREELARQSIERAQKQNNEILKYIEQLDKSAAPGSEQQSWDSRQLSAKIEETMRAQADSLRRSLEQLKENIDRLRSEDAEEIARKMDEISQALKEIIDMYGDSTLFPKDETGEISLKDLRSTLEKLNNMIPQLSERLDNTLRFLEALKRDRELLQFALRAEKLAEEQELLASDGNENPDAALARQKDLLDRIEKLQRDIKNDAELAADLKEEQSMNRIDSLGRLMKEQLSRRQNSSPANMRQMSASLTSLARQLREKMSSYMMEQLEALRNKLLDLVNSSLNLHAWQQRIRLKEPGDPQAARLQAMEQQALAEALSYLDSEVDSLPGCPPLFRSNLKGAVSSAEEAAKSAARSIAEGGGGFGMRISEQSISQLTAALLETVSAIDRQQNGSCGGDGAGLIRQCLRGMCGKQAAVNEATAALLRSMLNRKKTGDGAEGSDGEGNEAARKEAQAAQKAIADELKALAEKFGDGSAEEMRERVKQLEDEARKIAQMLDRPTEEATERQDRFLARMLQAALSLHREEEEKEERKSVSAKAIFTKTTIPFSDSVRGINDSFHSLRFRALQNGVYPPSYRTSINAYFDSLGVLFMK